MQELVPPWDPRLCPATSSRLLMRNYPYGGDKGVNELSRCPVSPRSFLIHTKMKSRPFPWVVESPRPLRHIWTSERLVFLPVAARFDFLYLSLPCLSSRDSSFCPLPFIPPQTRDRKGGAEHVSRPLPMAVTYQTSLLGDGPSELLETSPDPLSPWIPASCTRGPSSSRPHLVTLLSTSCASGLLSRASQRPGVPTHVHRPYATSP